MKCINRKTASRATSRGRIEKKAPKPESKEELVTRTKLSLNLAWMHPYIRKAKLKMPNLSLPDRIRSNKPGKTRIMRVMGNAYTHNKTLVITTHNQVTYLNRQGELKVKKIVRIPKAQMLDTLAHEMAHLHYPKHGYEHEEFTRAIYKTFGLKERCPVCKGSGKILMEGKY